jgi:hypothetical protein
MFAAPVLIYRSMTNFSAWVGGNGNRIKSKMAARYREKRTSITTVRDQYLSSATFPTPLIFHYPLPLMSFPRPIKWCHSYADLIWLDGTFINAVDLFSSYFLLLDENSKLRGNLEWPVTLPPRLVRDAFAIQPSRVFITFVLIFWQPLYVCVLHFWGLHR